MNNLIKAQHIESDCLLGREISIKKYQNVHRNFLHEYRFVVVFLRKHVPGMLLGQEITQILYASSLKFVALSFGLIRCYIIIITNIAKMHSIFRFGGSHIATDVTFLAVMYALFQIA